MSFIITGVDWPSFHKIEKADGQTIAFGIDGFVVSVRLEKKKNYDDCWFLELRVNRVMTGGQKNSNVNLKPGDLLCGQLYKQEKDKPYGRLEVKKLPQFV